jgi:hypothetical protein
MGYSLLYDHHGQFKVVGKENYLTRGEVADLVDRDRSRLRQLERQGRIPTPIKVKKGQLQVRLYSPAQVKVIVDYFAALPPKRRMWKLMNRLDNSGADL